jgi:AraC-like DNA-binding protein
MTTPVDQIKARPTLPVFLTPAQVAEMLRVSEKTVSRLSREDASMPVTRIRRVIRFERDPLLRCLGRKRPRCAQRLNPGPRPPEQIGVRSTASTCLDHVVWLRTVPRRVRPAVIVDGRCVIRALTCSASAAVSALLAGVWSTHVTVLASLRVDRCCRGDSLT